MSWVSLAAAVDGGLVTARYFKDIRDEQDYLKGDLEDQTEIELDCDMTTAVGLGFTSQAIAPGYLRRDYTHVAPGRFTFLAEHATTVNDPDFCALILGLKDYAATVEPLARIQAVYGGSVGKGDLGFETRTSGAWGTHPAFSLESRRMSVAGAGPNYTLDITGDLNALEFEGLTFWQQSPAGTAYHYASAIVSNQWISTLADGTAPIVAANGAPLCSNLNAEKLSGRAWQGAAVTGTGSATVTTAATDYTVASCTTSQAGLHLVVGEYTLTVDSGDLGASFYAKLTGATNFPSIIPKTAGDQMQIVATHLYQAAASEVLYLKARKNAKTGTSSAAGSIIAVWLGP